MGAPYLDDGAKYWLDGALKVDEGVPYDDDGALGAPYFEEGV